MLRACVYTKVLVYLNVFAKLSLYVLYGFCVCSIRLNSPNSDYYSHEEVPTHLSVYLSTKTTGYNQKLH